MRYNGDRIYVKPAALADADRLLELEQNNRDFFQKFSGRKKDTYYTFEGQQARLRQAIAEAEADQGYLFFICHNINDELIGRIELFEVARGNLESCWLGYFLDEDNNGKDNGKGIMSEALKLIVAHAFCDLNLHRIEAGVMPDNHASMRVLEKIGFQKEGIARKNVRINGVWQDHQTLAMLAEDLPAK